MTLVLLAVASLSLVLVPRAQAGMVTDCNHLPDFEGADVTTLVLQYEYAGRPGDRLSEAARNLSLLIQMDSLLTQLKYRNIGVAFVQTDPYAPNPCTPERVAQRMMGHIPSGKGVVILSGRLFEVEDRLYLQSSMLFLRKDVPEVLSLPANADLPKEATFTARLPQAPIAFAPRLLLKADIEAINAQFRQAMVVRQSRSYEAPGTPIELRGDMPFAYSVVGEQEGWMYIKPFRDYPGPEGWINFGDDTVHAALHRLLPELDYLDATVAYLQSRIRGPEGGAPSAGKLLEWSQAKFMQFGEMTMKDGAANADRTAMAIGLGMVGILETEQNGWGKEPGNANPFGAMVAAMPYSADARNLASLVDIYSCCLGGDRSVEPQTAERGLLDALSVDPGSSVALANLKSFYLQLQRLPDLRWPGMDEAALSKRLKAVQAVQQAQQQP
ncbi:MAG: hypothetical protein ACREFM_00765 [Hypericibacter sp.]